MPKSDRVRNWFITIFESNEIFKTISDKINSISDLKAYYYIEHKEELYTEEDIKKNEEYYKSLNIKVGDIQENHYHLILQFEQPKSFKQVSNLFSKCHLEQIEDLRRSIIYLTHKGMKDKKLYNISDIITNNYEYVDYCVNQSFKEEYDNTKILEYIYKDDLLCISQFYNRFGAIIKNDIFLINALLNDYNQKNYNYNTDASIGENHLFYED